MKKHQQIFNSILTLGLFISWMLPAYGQEVKTIRNSYQIKPNTLIEISNRYGDVVVTPWEKNQLDIKVEIKVKGKNEQRTKTLFDRINIRIDDDNPGSNISYTTDIDNINGRRNEKIEVNYYLRMPEAARLNLKNKYGSSFLGTLKGEVSLDLAYQGLVKIDALLGDNELNFRYSDNIKINEIENADKFRVSYSKIKIGKAKDINLEIRYSEAKIDRTDALNLTARYSELNLMKAKTIQGSFGYSGIEIERLTQKLEMSGSYGGDFEIEHVSQSVNMIDLRVSYTNVEIGIDPGLNADFSAKTSHGNISYDKSLVNCNYIENQRSTKTYKGKIGSGKQGSMRITNRYANIDVHSSRD
ncbi:MAG: hypothetical protein MI784_08145 [Cytophagales bacterium]|nr:hypothetical protein [Cytophagales bacterium]